MGTRKTKSGQAATKFRPWRLENQMEFVKPYLFINNVYVISNISPPPIPPMSVTDLQNEESLVTFHTVDIDRSH